MFISKMANELREVRGKAMKNKKMQEINNRLKNSRSQNSLLIGKETPMPGATSEYGLEKK